MTGNQPNPGVDMNQFNLEGFNQVSIEDVVKSTGVSYVAVISPFKIKKSIETIKTALAVKGVSVIISKEICSLYATEFKKQLQDLFI
ncbi:MAG: hypothetical protein HQK77_06790 [Desulfobacterales bacterium]|nr:hypothetical protein [Desulfobacterales bacterium]